MEKKNRRQKLIGIIGIVAMLSGILTGCGGNSDAAEPQEQETVVLGTPVETMITTREGFDKVITLGGVTAAESTVNVIAKVGGMEQIDAVNVKVGDKVSQGQVLAQLNTESTQISLANAQLAYDDAVRTYNNTLALYEAGGASQNMMEQAEMGMRNAENNLRSVQLSMNYATVTAPISGTITMVNAEVGSYASASAPMFEIANVDTLEISTGINEQNVSKIREGQEVLVKINSVSEEWFSSKITEISKVMNTQTKNYPITIALKNQDDKLVAGMYAEINVIVDHADNALMVPVNAIVYKEGNPVVFAIQPDSTVKQCAVTLGLNDGNKFQILSGLEAGTEIVIKGNNNLVDGEAVTIIKPNIDAPAAQEQDAVDPATDNQADSSAE